MADSKVKPEYTCTEFCSSANVRESKCFSTFFAILYKLTPTVKKTTEEKFSAIYRSEALRVQ